jgi:DNA-binding beta-propeller fold protein YncE
MVRVASEMPVRAQPQQTSQSLPTLQNADVPKIPFDSVPDYFKYSAQMNLGEVLAVAVNSKGRVLMLNHPGSATSGPLYGNAATQLLEFDETGKFVREIGKGVYGLGYAHGARYDKYDNLWIVDKGTHAVMRFNPAGYVTLNLGRRPEGPDEPDYYKGNGLRGNTPAPQHVDGNFRAPTDVAFDSDDNLYISDGYINSRVAKFDKHGNWIKSWGSRGTGGTHANENPGQLNTPHNIGIDRQNNVYVADRGNRRIQVFDGDGRFTREIRIDVPMPPDARPWMGNPPSLEQAAAQNGAPWAICITPGANQVLYSADAFPGRIYKLSLDGKVLGWLGKSGHAMKQFGWIHEIACPSENEIYVAELLNWRVQKLTLRPQQAKTSTAGEE